MLCFIDGDGLFNFIGKELSVWEKSCFYFLFFFSVGFYVSEMGFWVNMFGKKNWCEVGCDCDDDIGLCFELW